MKSRLIWILKAMAITLALCVLQKPFFMLCNHSLYADAGAAGWFGAIWHGLVIDASVTGYLSVIPCLLAIASVWVGKKFIKPVAAIYFGILSVILSFVFICDAALYPYWGFKLDSTPFFYFFSSPADAMASATTAQKFILAIGWLVMAALMWWSYYAALIRGKMMDFDSHPHHRAATTAVLALITAALFIPIRGGFTVSTMNVGKAFFSNSQPLNHAAVNPLFSLFDSMAHSEDFASKYRFMSDAEADAEIKRWTAREKSLHASDSIPPAPLLNISQSGGRPNVLLVILESFSSKLLSETGGEPGVAVNLDSIARQGVLFTNFYANSFRTDRGLVAILSGYPAQPTSSIMKYPRKSQSLPGIAGTLREAGYDTEYYYGGDADFTNMRSYLMATGYDRIVSDTDFPISQRLSKWGVHDHLVFDRLAADLNAKKTGKPFFVTLQSSSSHEPFEVPYKRLANERLNAFTYTDSCVGALVRELKEMPLWNNTLVVIVPDHLGAYPENISNFELDRYRIPLILTGGAVNAPARVATVGSQQDIAATLLEALRIRHDQFSFSKDLMNPAEAHFAFFTVPDAFGVVTPENSVIFDNQSGRAVLDEGPSPGSNLRFGQAYLQKLYDDLAGR